MLHVYVASCLEQLHNYFPLHNSIKAHTKTPNLPSKNRNSLKNSWNNKAAQLPIFLRMPLESRNVPRGRSAFCCANNLSPISSKCKFFLRNLALWKYAKKTLSLVDRVKVLMDFSTFREGYQKLHFTSTGTQHPPNLLGLEKNHFTNPFFILSKAAQRAPSQKLKASFLAQAQKPELGSKRGTKCLLFKYVAAECNYYESRHRFTHVVFLHFLEHTSYYGGSERDQWRVQSTVNLKKSLGEPTTPLAGVYMEMF